MRRTVFIFFACFLSLTIHAQKKNKSKDKANTNFQVADSLNPTDSVIAPPSTTKSSKKGKELTKGTTTNYVKKDSKDDKKGKTDKKDDKKGKKETVVNFKEPETEPTPVADTSKRFVGVIKYRMTTDDPADKDSIFIVFGEGQVRVTMFAPGYREGQVFETNSIINFKDSTFLDVDVRNMTYKTEKLGARNEGFEFALSNTKKTAPVMTITCQEYKGEMTTPDGDSFEAACLVSSQYQYMSAMDYNFQNIQPLILGYKIVLGFRTRSSENENTYFMAYKILPGNTSPYFDLSQYRPK
jgi:hypothetical protein